MALEIPPIPRALHALRETAIERIRYFQTALEARGLRVRMGAELEFFPLGKNNKPLPNLLDARHLTQQLGKEVPTVERIYKEAVRDDTQYELVTGIHPKAAHRGISLASPLATAETVAAFKSGMRAKAPQWGLGGISFRASMLSGSSLQTSGLHINTSVWDKAGDRNLFYAFGHATTDLERHIADALIETHATTAPAYLPFAQSYERIASSANIDDVASAAPTHAGLMYNKGMTYTKLLGSIKKLVGIEPEVASVAARHRSILHMPLGVVTKGFGGRTIMIGWERPHQYRLESRLAGADADPYVVVATELASVYDAVVNHTQPWVRGASVPSTHRLVDLGDQGLLVRKHRGAFSSHRLSLDITTSHAALIANHRMREVMGEDLFHALAATSRPEGVTSLEIDESVGHFSRYVQSRSGHPHSVTDITGQMHAALDGIERPYRQESGAGAWLRRIFTKSADSHLSRA